MTSAVELFRAWSCTMRLVVADGRRIGAAAADLKAMLDRVDRVGSRFHADSELNRANDNAGRPTPVSPLLISMVDAALEAARRTEGAVDPTLGRVISALGYSRDFSEIGTGAEVDGPKPRKSRRLGELWRQVRVDRAAGLLTVPSGAALDLGATGKAWAADRAANLLHGRYKTAVLVELGGDLAVAGILRGGWPVHVAEAEGADGQVVIMQEGGLATSTTTIRRWKLAGRRLHHVIDPGTGAPAAGPWRTASVFAPTALAANTASTAALVLGESAERWLSVRRLPARLIAQDGTVRTTGDWPMAEPSGEVAS